MRSNDNNKSNIYLRMCLFMKLEGQWRVRLIRSRAIREASERICLGRQAGFWIDRRKKVEGVWLKSAWAESWETSKWDAFSVLVAAVGSSEGSWVRAHMIKASLFSLFHLPQVQRAPYDWCTAMHLPLEFWLHQWFLFPPRLTFCAEDLENTRISPGQELWFHKCRDGWRMKNETR